MEIYFKKNKYLNDGKLDPREELRSFGEDKNSRANLEAALRALNEMDALKVKREELESLLETQKSKLEDKNFGIKDTIDEIEYAALNIDVLPMTPEHRKIWDVLRRSVKPNEIPDGSSAEVDAPAQASSQDLIGCLNFSPCFAAPNSLVATSSVPSPSTSSSSVNPSGTSDRQKSLLSYSKIEAMNVSSSPTSISSSHQRLNATAPQPSTSFSTTASTSQIASGDGRRRCRKREATPHPKEADKRSRN